MENCIVYVYVKNINVSVLNVKLPKIGGFSCTLLERYVISTWAVIMSKMEGIRMHLKYVFDYTSTIV